MRACRLATGLIRIQLMHIRLSRQRHLSRDRHIAMPLVQRVYDIHLNRKEQSENQQRGKEPAHSR